MTRLYIFLISLWGLVACKQIQDKPTDEKPAYIRTYATDFDRRYNIPDLQNYGDSTAFAAKLYFVSPFHIPYTFIELQGHGSVYLCVKQYQVRREESEWTPNYSLPFDQHCYDYQGTEAEEIRTLFRKYAVGKVVKDTICTMCLDYTSWKVDILDHGRYSSVYKDHITKEDSVFIFTLLQKVNLTAKNEYWLKNTYQIEKY